MTTPWVPVDDRLEAATTGCASHCGLELRVTTGGARVYDEVHGQWTADRLTFIASATKWLAGATIMTVVDDGLLSLDDTWAPGSPPTRARRKAPSPWRSSRR